MSYKLIIFDCDGTLVDTEYLNNLAMIETLQAYGLSHYTIDYALDHFAGLKFSKISENIEKETGFSLPPAASKKYIARAYELGKTEMKEIDGVKDVVTFAKSKSDICVVSNGEHNNVVTSLKRANLYNLFDPDFVFTGKMAPNPKPAPDLFLLAAQKKQVSPSECLVIEDSVAGVTGAVSAGMDVIGFYGTHHKKEAHKKALTNHGAINVFSNMVCLSQYLTNDVLKETN